MNKQLLELAQRAVACDHWRWMVGTPAVAEFHGKKVGLVCIYANHQHMADFYCIDYGEEWENIHVSDQRSMGMLPDLDNPATLGCLLHLVREAWGDPDLAPTMAVGGTWGIWPQPHLGVDHPTEAHALITALEAADE